jgi:cytochrome c oxidase cbb3-type subunit 3
MVMLGLACLPTGRAEEQTVDQQAQRLLAARCAVCHSTDLIQQQRLPRDRWEATVDKMVHWGAQLDTTEEAMLTAYLTKYFHPEAGPVVELPVAPLFNEEPSASLTPGGASARGKREAAAWDPSWRAIQS